MNKLMTMAMVTCFAGLMTGCSSMCASDAACSACGKKGMGMTSGRCSNAGGCAAGVCMAKVSGASADTMKEGVVNTAALVAMLRTKTPMTLLDARTGKFDDGNRIPGALALAPDASEAQVTAILPDKQKLVVTYCANLKCPASHMLGERLRQLGYANVLEYREGIDGWAAGGNTIEKAAR